MSKKSRRRNKKILAMLALAGGAALAGRGKGTAQGVSGSDKAKFTSDAAYSPAPKAVTGTTYPGANKAADAAAITGVQEGNTRLKRDGMGPMESVIAKRKIPGYGTAVAPPGILNPYRAPRAGLGPRRFKHGGSVTGAAKRGFGRALMKGKK